MMLKFWLPLKQGARVGHVNKTLPTLDEAGEGRDFGNFPKLVGGEDRPTSSSIFSSTANLIVIYDFF